MSPAKAARKIELESSTATHQLPRRQHDLDHCSRTTTLHAVKRESAFNFPGRMPVIIGEATYRGMLPVDGLLSGQLNGSGGALTVKQRTRHGSSVPELDGEIHFKDMVRINGHIAGKVISERGTLIISELAIVDGSIDVDSAVINGTVNGDVVAHKRVELGPSAIINGNISSPALTIRPGAIFHGRCCMIANRNGVR